MKKFKVFNITKKQLIFCGAAVIIFLTGALLLGSYGLRVRSVNAEKAEKAENDEKEYIKWIEFGAKYSSLQKALKYDTDSYGTETPLNWIELLSYAAAKNWGNMKDDKKINQYIDEGAKKLSGGKTIGELTADLKLYNYYYETYYSVLGGFVGEYELADNDSITRKYGLKVFSPVAKGYSYSHYDDFGNSRSYGYKRRHLGNDLLGSVGTPIIAIEDGYVEALGWNQYGGWRVGIRTHDMKRYYYYAHLRKDHPFKTGLKEGDFVQAGDVIGYLGMTGYSRKENVNNIKIPHLHFGLQIIFDEVQKDGTNQIWIDVYHIIELLEKNKMSVARASESKDFERTVKINNIVTD